MYISAGCKIKQLVCLLLSSYNPTFIFNSLTLKKDAHVGTKNMLQIYLMATIEILYTTPYQLQRVFRLQMYKNDNMLKYWPNDTTALSLVTQGWITIA